jgi:sulfide:quinone oxidoreductase
MNPQKTIVILGGGMGGLVSANLLAKKIGGLAEIILIDKNENHIFQPSFLWVLFGKRAAREIQKPLSILKQKGIEFVQDEAVKINPEKKFIETKNRSFYYDYLIISLGAELAPEKIPGMAQRGYNLYELKEIEKLRDDLKNFQGGKIAVVIASLPFKCPAAPYEAAFLLDEYFEKRGLRNKIEIGIFTPESLPMPSAGPEIGKAIKAMLEARNIGFYAEHQILSVNAGAKKLEFKDKEAADFDWLIYVPPHQGAKVIRDSDLGEGAGWIPVDAKTLRTKYEDIFAIGDAALVALSSGKPLPKAGVFAHFEAEVAAENIASKIKGRLPAKEYNGWASCFLETGYGKAGFASGNFYAKPTPAIKMKQPGRIWHWTKILLEKYWLWKWF